MNFNSTSQGLLTKILPLTSYVILEKSFPFSIASTKWSCKKFNYTSKVSVNTKRYECLHPFLYINTQPIEY